MKLFGNKGGGGKLTENIADLIKVKTIVTLVTTIVFAVLTIRGNEVSEYFKYVYTGIIMFYFGTQYESNKRERHKDNDNGKQ